MRETVVVAQVLRPVAVARVPDSARAHQRLARVAAPVAPQRQPDAVEVTIAGAPAAALAALVGSSAAGVTSRAETSAVVHSEVMALAARATVAVADARVPLPVAAVAAATSVPVVVRVAMVAHPRRQARHRV